LATLVSAIVTFIVFAYSIQLIAIQLVSTSMSPRIIAIVYRSRPARNTLALFMLTFIYSVNVLGRIDARVPDLCLMIALLLSLLSIGAFVMLVDLFGKSLRPVSILSRIGAEGAEVVAAVYPDPVVASDAAILPADAVQLGTPDRIVEMIGLSGILVAFDGGGLRAIAERADCTIELLPQVGDFVAKGDPLFRVYGQGAAEVDAAALAGTVAFGTERTFPQDPLFAFRIVVDVAAKALSPAINDPTTAVLAVDQLHRLLRVVGRRRLDSGVVRDDSGNVRFVYRTPNWDDFVRLALTEMRHYGITSIQVVRRLRAMLENLSENLPAKRGQVLNEELHRLNVAVERAFSDAWDREMAAVGDSQGMGSPLAQSPSPVEHSAPQT
jgi:uncharacterized membrane protein